jgi:hypothetical protein
MGVDEIGISVGMTNRFSSGDTPALIAKKPCESDGVNAGPGASRQRPKAARR